MRSTQRSALGDDDTKYLTSEEIEKLADPKRGLNQLPTDISSKDWEVQVNSWNVLRSIAIHNCYLLDSSFFKTILPDLIKIASSLRSSVCKNGLLAFQDLFKNCSKHIEFDLESIANILIKKSNDTNVFISAEAEKTLLSMWSYWNEQKVLTTIMTHSSNRSPQVKSKVAKWLEQIIVKLSNKFTSFKENNKVIDQLAIYLSDASQEVRTDAKKAFNTLSQLWSKAEFEEMMNKSLSEQKYNKVKELLEKGFQTSMSEFNPTKQSFYREGSNRSSRKQLVNGGNSSNGFDLEGGMSSSSKFKSSSSIPKIKEEDGSPTDSKYSLYSKRHLNNSKYSSNGNNKFERNSDRNSTISVINSTANSRIQKIIPKDGNDKLANNTDVEDNKSTKSSPNKYSKQKKISRSSIKRLDEKSVPRAPDFSKREATDIEIVEEKDVFVQLNHPDSKISSKAAEVLINNYEEYEKDVPNNLPIIFKSQSNLFCSNNENIRLKAEELIDKWVNRVKASLTVKSIWNTVSTCNNKAKLMLLEKLNKILPQVAEENPVLLSKYVLPVVYTLLDDKSKFIKKKTWWWRWWDEWWWCELEFE